MSYHTYMYTYTYTHVYGSVVYVKQVLPKHWYSTHI